MTDISPEVIMCPGEGSEHFSDNADTYINTYRSVQPLITDCIGKIKLEKDECFVFCDYGSADGGTSISLVKAVIECVKNQHGSNQEVHVIYEDQPTNDFNSLFRIIHGLSPCIASYLHHFSNVYVSACGTSIYRQCLPSESVHLGMSISALHWLSQKPCQVSDGLFCFVDPNPDEYSKFKAQAAEDWQNALLARSRELKVGGQCFLWAACRKDNGHHTGKKEGQEVSFFTHMTQIWRNLMEETIITAQEYKNTTFNAYIRTVDEFQEPFCDSDSAVSKSGLKLISLEIQKVKGLMYSNWESAGFTADDTVAAKTYAKAFVSFMQKWSKPTITSGLFYERTPEEINKIITAFYKRLEDEVALDPYNNDDDQVLCLVHMQKH